MDNIFLELLKRSQNIKAKYCERMVTLEQEIEKLMIDLQKVESMHKKKKKKNKEDDQKSKKEIDNLQKTLSDIEKRCEESCTSYNESSSSTSSSSSSSDSSSCSTTSSSSGRSTSSGSRFSSIEEKDDQKAHKNEKTIQNSEEKKSQNKKKSEKEKKPKSTNHKPDKEKKSISDDYDETSNSSKNDKNSDDEQNSNSEDDEETFNSSKNDKNSDDETSSSSSKKSKKSDSNKPSNSPLISPQTNGLFSYLFSKLNKNPINENMIEISGNSFDEYEQNLLQNVIDPKWEQNHWLSKNNANSSITIKFNRFSFKINKYRVRIGCTNGLGRFSSWEIEGITKDNRKITLDKVENCPEISQSHPEIVKTIQSDVFVCSIKFMMRGKNTDGNYKMRFRNIELFGDMK